MYQIGDHIIYGGDGVCRVEAVGNAPDAWGDPDKTYYTLRPLYHDGVIFAPTDVNVRMRPVLTREQAWALIHNIPNMKTEEAPYADARLATTKYQSFLQTYECADLLHLIRMIYNKNLPVIANGKAYGQIDSRFFKRAKELLYGELAVSLDIPVDQVEETIVRTLDEPENAEKES